MFKSGGGTSKTFGEKVFNYMKGEKGVCSRFFLPVPRTKFRTCPTKTPLWQYNYSTWPHTIEHV